ncbi:MAG: hypothetical protein IPO25_20580 [Saprospiraceae bacterium]|nr:hypothetical protein [Saprospiraceae bacterium]
MSLIILLVPTLSLTTTTCSADLTTYSINFSSNGTVSSSAGTVNNSTKTISGIPSGNNVTLTSSLNSCNNYLIYSPILHLSIPLSPRSAAAIKQSALMNRSQT